MTFVYNSSISLDKEITDFLNKFKKKYKINKSLIIRALVHEFIGREKELINLIINDEEKND